MKAMFHFLGSIINGIIILFITLINSFTDGVNFFISTFTHLPSIFYSIFLSLPEFYQIGIRGVFGLLLLVIILKIIVLIKEINPLA